MDMYTSKRIIGSGSFGTVYHVKLNNTDYVLKEINMQHLNPVEKQRAFNEVSLLSRLKHRYIVEYKNSSLDYNSGNLLIVMEYADCGDIANAILKQKGIPFAEDLIIFWFIQISLALQFIHSQNILHRDLKPQNIFLCKDNTVKVGDFGIARVLKNSEDFANTGIGTPFYLSPEICLQKPYNSKSDMWALGCILFELSALVRPFNAETFPHLVRTILKGKYKPLPHWSSNLIKQLVDDLLSLDPLKRPSTDEVLAYPSLQPYLLKENFFRPRKSRVSSGNGLKRSASSALSSNCSKTIRIAPTIDKNEKKYQHSSTRVATPVRVVSENKSLENVRKPRSASTSQVIVGTECKTTDKFLSKPIVRNRNNMDTYTVGNKTNCNGSPKLCHITFESSSKIMDFDDRSLSAIVCDHMKDTGNQSSILKKKEHLDSLSNPTHCSHLQCYECMIDMMWKNRIRGCGDICVDEKNYLRLKNKLLLIFKPDLFQRFYESLLHIWNDESDTSIRRHLQGLTYEQLQNFPLMIQLIQLDIARLSKIETSSDEVILF